MQRQKLSGWQRLHNYWSFAGAGVRPEEQLIYPHEKTIIRPFFLQLIQATPSLSTLSFSQSPFWISGNVPCATCQQCPPSTVSLLPCFQDMLLAACWPVTAWWLVSSPQWGHCTSLVLQISWCVYAKFPLTLLKRGFLLLLLHCHIF